MPRRRNVEEEDDYDAELDEIVPVSSHEGKSKSSKRTNERRLQTEDDDNDDGLDEIVPVTSNRRNPQTCRTRHAEEAEDENRSERDDRSDRGGGNESGQGDGDDDDDDDDVELTLEGMNEQIDSYFEVLRIEGHGSSRHREMRDYVYKVLNWDGDTSPDKVVLITRASKLYIEQLYRIQQVSYDDVVYSTCLHKMTRMVKEASTFKSSQQTGNSVSNKILYISSDERISMNEYVSFWSHTVRRFHDHYLNNSSLVNHLIHAFMQLLKYARAQSLLQLVSDFFQEVLPDRSSDVLRNVITTIYKNGYQLLLTSLPTPNRNVLIQLLTETALQEQNTFRSSGDEDDDNEDGDGNGSNEENDENQADEINQAENEDQGDNPNATGGGKDGEDGDGDDDRDGDVVTGENGESEDQTQSEKAKKKKKSVSARREYPKPITVLFKVCIEQVKDKAIIRAGLSQSMDGVIRYLSFDYHQKFVTILLQCAIHRKVSARLVTIDVASRLLSKFCASYSRENGSGATVELKRKLVSVLVGRCKDRMGSVRSKAISSLLEVISSGDHSDLFNSSTLDEFVTGMRLRIRDDKSTVRKSMVDFLGYALKLMLTNGNEVDNMRNKPADLFSLLMNRCGDVVASVRLAAGNQIVSLIAQLCKNSELWKTEKYGTDVLVDAMQHVLRMLDDVDNRCRNVCLSLVRNMVVHDDAVDQSNDKIYSLFYCMMGGHDRIVTRLCERALHSLCRDEGASIVRRDVSHIFKRLSGVNDDDDVDMSSENGNAMDKEKIAMLRKGVWLTLAALATGGMEKDVWRVVGAEVIMGEIRNGTNGHACRIALAHVAHMDEEMKLALKEQLLSVLFTRTPSSSEEEEHEERNDENGNDNNGNDDNDTAHDDIEGQVSVTCEVIGRLQGGDECGDMYLERCENELIERENITKRDIAHALSVIGNICQWMPLQNAPSDKILAYVERMTMSEQSDETLKRVGALALVCLGRICLCETRVVTSCTSRSRGGGGGVGTVGSKKGQKIGEMLTRRFISMFVHQLDNANSRATRNNAVVVICDLCRKYTTLVEPFMTRVAGVMSDESWFVRHQAICSLMNLLQEDYIKVRPGTFVLLQMVKSVVDGHAEVRKVVEYALEHIIVIKNRTCLSTCFVQLVAMLNGCDEHSDVLKQFRGVLRPDIDTTGKDNAVKRRRFAVYERVLRVLPNEQRYRLPGRLVNDVIIPIAEEKWQLDTEGVDDMLHDVFKLLCSDKVNVFAKRAFGNAANVSEEALQAQMQESQQVTTTGGAGDSQQDGTGTGLSNPNILRNVQLLELREVTVPVLIELRQVLQARRSPMLGPLHACLCELLHPHRESIGQFIPDSVVRAQIQHEMQRGEKERG